MPGNDEFRSYVTSTAFSLSLSGNMITALEHLATHKPVSRGWAEFDRPIWSAKDALIRRGLITNLGAANGADITEAGWLVLRLCALAGLCELPGDVADAA